MSVHPVVAELGEGPVWVKRDAALWFVDIKARHIHRFDPASRKLTSWTAPAQPGWVLPCDDGGMMAGLQTGLHRFDPASGSFALVIDPEPALPRNRLNDATVDASGRLWFGTMDDGETEATGSLYCFDRGRLFRAAFPSVCITNGPALSPDGGLIYHVDTLGRTIWTADVRDERTLGPPRLFATIEDGAGHPDGVVVDAEGCLWVGLFGGWSVRRYAPDGALMRFVRFPVANITKVAFGGDGLRTAYATTARMGLDPQALAAQPLAGNLFAFDPDVAGLPAHDIALTP